MSSIMDLVELDLQKYLLRQEPLSVYAEAIATAAFYAGVNVGMNTHTFIDEAYKLPEVPKSQAE